MKEPNLILSVDGGGSSSKAVLYEQSGFMFRETIVGPMSCKSSTSEVVEASLLDLHAFIKEYVSQIKSCVLALSGLDSDTDINRIVDLLGQAGFFGEPSNVSKIAFATCVKSYWGFPVLLCSDALLPLFANYFDSGSIVISGTGSIAINLSEKGQITRIGGWGYSVSDEGSGTWIGMQFLKKVLSACDRTISSLNARIPVSDEDTELIDIACDLLFDSQDQANKNFDISQKALSIESWSIRTNDAKVYASLAKGVTFYAYNMKNTVCLDIASEAADKLAYLAFLSFNEQTPFIVLSGGVFNNDTFACDVKNKIFKLCDGKSRTIVNKVEPASGGIGIAKFFQDLIVQ